MWVDRLTFRPFYIPTLMSPPYRTRRMRLDWTMWGNPIASVWNRTPIPHDMKHLRTHGTGNVSALSPWYRMHGTPCHYNNASGRNSTTVRTVDRHGRSVYELRTNWAPSNLHHQIKHTLHTQPGVTYAQITKQNFYAATNIEQDQHMNKSQ
jgi:hypothetical protein